MYRCTGALKSRLKARGGSSAACVAVPGAAEPSSAGTQPALHAAPPKPDHATHALQRFSRAHVTGVRTVAAAGSAPRSACWPRRPSASRGGGGCVDGAGALARDFEGAAVSAWVGRGRSSATDPGPPAWQGRRFLPRHGPGGRGGRGRRPRPHAQSAVAAWQPGRRRLRRRFRAGAPRTLAPQPPCLPGPAASPAPDGVARAVHTLSPRSSWRMLSNPRRPALPGASCGSLAPGLPAARVQRRFYARAGADAAPSSCGGTRVQDLGRRARAGLRVEKRPRALHACAARRLSSPTFASWRRT